MTMFLFPPKITTQDFVGPMIEVPPGKPDTNLKNETPFGLMDL